MNNGHQIRQLQKRLWNQKRRNKGSSIVIVIIAMAMIGILATTLLWMSYYGYKIKANDIQNKNNFYSAETIMEQIIAGLQGEASDAMAKSYQMVLSNWDDYEGSESNRFSAFAASYLDTLVDEFRMSGNPDQYDRNKLKDYVDHDLWNNVDEGMWENGTDDSAALEAKMELVNGNSLILRNLFVSYTDPVNNRVSVIRTDICLDVPYVVFEQSASIDQLYDYALIGNQGVIVDGDGKTTVSGSIYAGIHEPEEGKKKEDTTLTDGIHVQGTSKISVEHAKYVISKGDIIVGSQQMNGGTKALFSVEQDKNGTSLYAGNLDVNGGTLNLNCKTYVANDLELYGSGSKATIEDEYYGYGNRQLIGLNDTVTNQDQSSSVIVNGSNATIDMRKVRTLMLAGRAYIGRSITKQTSLSGTEGETSSTGEEQKNAVLMGESITVKGGQIAYLVPPECLGVLGEEVIIGQNPITLKQHNQIAEYKQNSAEQFKEVDFGKPVNKLNGKSLSEYGVSDMSHIRKVSVPNPDEENKAFTYYYLVMEPDDAARYFEDYYAINKESIDHYFKKYAVGGIMLGDKSQGPEDSYTILGNALVSQMTDDGTGMTGEVRLMTQSNSSISAMTSDEVEKEALKIGKEVEHLTTNLKEDGGDPAKDVFQNIIRQTELTDFLGTGEKTVPFTTDSGLVGILTSEDEYSLSEAGSEVSNVRLIVSTGKNVTIDRNFKGIVICRGTITINSGMATDIRNRNYLSSSNQADSINKELYRVLNAEYTDSGTVYKPLDFFVNGTTSLKEEVNQAPTDQYGNLDINYTKIVRYVNWEKR